MSEGLRLDIPLEEVRAAVAEYVKEVGYTESWTTASQLASRLRLDRNATGYEAVSAWDLFSGRVSRELNRLAAAGELVKVGGGELMPSGNRLSRNESRYYTRDRYEADARQAAERARQLDVAREHREAILARLRALVLPPSVTGGGRITLDYDHWDILLDLAEKGAQR